MFDSEIRGQLAMLMGGRAAEQLTCSSVSTGAVGGRQLSETSHRQPFTPSCRASSSGGWVPACSLFCAWTMVS